MKCETCRWFKLIAETGPWAQCRRYPPRWVDQETCAYPVVTAADGCGEYEKAPQDFTATPS
jgi:hypothetical protein